MQDHKNRRLVEIRYTATAIEHRNFWKQSGQVAIMKKISNLLDDIVEHPETGIGKPEQLKHELSGVWSRHIDKGNRLVYEIHSDHIMVLAMKGHYNL